MADLRSDFAGVRVSVAFVFNCSFEAAQRLVAEVERCNDARLVYTKVAVRRLKIVGETPP
jgi:hypothetical protein